MIGDQTTPMLYLLGEKYIASLEKLGESGSSKVVVMPLAAIWGDAGIPDEGGTSPLETWRDWADDVSGGPVDSGHYLAEEAPEETLGALMDFLLD